MEVGSDIEVERGLVVDGRGRDREQAVQRTMNNMW